MKRLLGWALVLGLSLASCHAATSSGAPTTAFLDVNVVPMDQERVLRQQTVLVRDDTIVAIGPADEVAVPPDATRIDGDGAYLMPGLADMHVHIWNQDDFLLYLANGVTTIRNMFGSPLHLAWRSRIASGELLGPTLVTAGPIVDGNPPIWPGSTVVETAQEGRETVAAHVEQGYDFVKVYSRLGSDAYDGIVEAAREAGMPFCGHVPTDVGIERVIAAGQRSIEHLDGFAQALEVADAPPVDLRGQLARLWSLEAIDAGGAGPIADALADGDVWSCPTLVVMRKFVSAADADELHRDPVMRFVPPTTRAMWDPTTDFRMRDMDGDDFAAIRRGDAIRRSLVATLRERGARLLLGTDALNPFVVPGFSIHEELALLVDAGLSPFEALAAGTRDAARYLGREDVVGTIAPGRRADLVLVRGNPLEDVGHLRDRVGVMVRGRWLTEAELLDRLEAQADRYAGTRERLSPASAPAEGDDVVYRARFELTYNDSVFAAERTTWKDLADGRRALSVQIAYDPPIEFAADMEMEFGPAPGDERIQAKVTSQLGEGSARIERRGAELTITGDGLFAGEPRTLDVAPDAILSLPAMASERQVFAAIGDLEPGERVALALLSVDFEEEVTVDPTHWVIVRKPDETIDTHVGTRVARVYRMSSRGMDSVAPVTSTLYLDSEGRPWGLDQDDPLGVIQSRRIE